MKNEAEDWVKEGLAFIEQNDYTNAIDSLIKAIQINPNFFEAWFRLGVAYFWKQDYEKALKCYLKAWEVNPASAYIDEDIDKCYNKLVDYNSKDFNAWSRIGDYYFNKGIYKKALECYDRTIDRVRLSNKSHKLTEFFIKKGKIFYEIGELDSAVKSYDRALEIDSTDEIAQENRIKVLKEINKKKRCSECGAPLKLKLGQFLGDQQYIIVDVEHLKFLMKRTKAYIESKSSYEKEKFKKIEDNYKKIHLIEVYQDE